MGFRRANEADVTLLRFWDEQPHNRSSDPNSDWEWETELRRNPDWRQQLIFEKGDRPVGFVQIIDPAREDSHYWGDVEEDLRAIDIWIGVETDLGKGHGSEMMMLALKRCFAEPRVKAVLVDPLATNTRAHRFYERHGFKFVEKRTFGPDECYVFRKERPIGDDST